MIFPRGWVFAFVLFHSCHAFHIMFILLHHGIIMCIFMLWAFCIWGMFFGILASSFPPHHLLSFPFFSWLASVILPYSWNVHLLPINLAPCLEPPLPSFTSFRMVLVGFKNASSLNYNSNLEYFNTFKNYQSNFIKYFTNSGSGGYFYLTQTPLHFPYAFLLFFCLKKIEKRKRSRAAAPIWPWPPRQAQLAPRQWAQRASQPARPPLPLFLTRAPAPSLASCHVVASAPPVGASL